jgi:transcriptional regulator with XRE-family HTH domain
MLKKYADDLKYFRKNKGKSLKDVAAETRIHISNLEKIESGDFSFLPQPYVRAFLRQYIKAIGLNEKESLYNFDLAKSGKYQSKIIEKPREEKKPVNESYENKLFNESEEKKHEKNNSVEDVPPSLGKIVDENEDSYETGEPFITEQKKVIKKYSSSIKVEMENAAPTNDYSGKISMPGKGTFNIPPSVYKTTGIIFSVLLLLLGVYLLITQVFIGNSNKSKYEIVRQNFDEVVKESEKKILGKRSEEEIADSLNKARLIQDSIKRALNDSVTLEIKGLSKGTITIVIDSIAGKNMDRETFGKDYTGIWKAKKTFYLTSGNTESFEAYLNGKKLNFEDKKISNQKITKEGILKNNNK